MKLPTYVYACAIILFCPNIVISLNWNLIYAQHIKKANTASNAHPSTDSVGEIGPNKSSYTMPQECSIPPPLNPAQTSVRKPMKALILVGGYGTRLRPLTLTIPKPLVPFANQLMILHQIEALKKAGVTEVILAVNYRPEIMQKAMQPYEEASGVKITFSVETEPLGTAGPLALAKSLLNQNDEPFFVLNSDIICDFPFDKMLEAHKQSGAEGTILVTKVDEPSKYGVVVCQQGTMKIDRFVEKPAEFISNRINAGIYILSPKILDRISPKPTSIEKEVFPKVVEDNSLYCFDLEGFWMDVGQPKDYLKGTSLYLNHLAKKNPKQLFKSDSTFNIKGNVMIDSTAVIGENCEIGPDVVIGPNVVVGPGARISRAVVMEGSKICPHAFITNSIIGWNARIGKWARIEGISILGADVAVADEIYVNGGCILPHKSISNSIQSPEIVM